MLDGVELCEAAEHDDWAGFSVVAGPAAEPGEDPGCVGERSAGVWVLLPLGLAFEALAPDAIYCANSAEGSTPTTEAVMQVARKPTIIAFQTMPMISFCRVGARIE